MGSNNTRMLKEQMTVNTELVVIKLRWMWLKSPTPSLLPRSAPSPAGCSVLLSVGEAARQAARNYKAHSSPPAARLLQDWERPQGTLGVAVLAGRGSCSVTATEEERKVSPSAFLPVIPPSVITHSSSRLLFAAVCVCWFESLTSSPLFLLHQFSLFTFSNQNRDWRSSEELDLHQFGST